MAKSLEAQLKAIADRRNGDIEKVAKASILRVGNMMITGSPFDSGRFINNWMSAFNKIDRNTGRSAQVSGSDSSFDLRDTLSRLDIGFSFYFANSLPYAKRLEYGWSAQSPKGMVRQSILHWDKIVKEEVKKRK